jgi:hypothetical protein
MANFKTTINETDDTTELTMSTKDSKAKNHETKHETKSHGKFGADAPAHGDDDRTGLGSPAVNPTPEDPGLRPEDPGESHRGPGGVYEAEGLPPGSVQDPTGEHGSAGPDPYREVAAASGEYDREGRVTGQRRVTGRKVDPSIPEWQRDQEFEAMPSNPPPPSTLEEATPDLDKLSETTKAEMKAGKEAIDAAKGAPGAEARAGREAGRQNSGV